MAGHGSHILPDHHGMAWPALRNMLMDYTQGRQSHQLGQIFPGVTLAPQKTVH